MNHLLNNSSSNLYTCRYCLQDLSAEAFYIDKRTNLPDNFCKQCRSMAARSRYFRKQNVDEKRQYPVITDLPDPEQRTVFILHALRVVNESIARKRNKLHEYELAHFSSATNP